MGVDSIVGDSIASDSATSDSSSSDSGAAVDSTITDSGVDASMDDSGSMTDSGVDSGSDDTGTMSVDSGPADTGTVTMMDAGKPLLSSNPGQVYCDTSSGADTLCPAGQTCCGTAPAFGSYTFGCTSGSCNGPAFGSSNSFACNEKADCGGHYCCIDSGWFDSNINGTHCASGSGAGSCSGDVACMVSTDCPTMMTCVANKAQNGDFTVGRCQ
jgi:hypothetical protein